MLAATLAERAELRHTPVGIPVLECTLAHRSTQREAGHERAVECELHAVAVGEVAQALSAVGIGRGPGFRDHRREHPQKLGADVLGVRGRNRLD